MLVILLKDLRLFFLRTGFFFVAVIVSLGLYALVRFSLPAGSLDFKVSVAILWLVHLIGTLFVLVASAEYEWEWQANRLYRLAGVAGHYVFLGKSLALFLVIMLLWLVDLFVWLLFFQPRLPNQNLSLVALVLGLLPAGFFTSLGFAFAGVMAAGLAVHARYRHVLLFVLKFPLTLPLLISASNFTRAFAKSADLFASMAVLNLEIAFVFIFAGAGLAMYDFLLEE